MDFPGHELIVGVRVARVFDFASADRDRYAPEQVEVVCVVKVQVRKEHQIEIRGFHVAVFERA